MHRGDSFFDDVSVAEAQKMAKDLTVAEIERKARRFVRADSVFNWCVITALGVAMAVIRCTEPHQRGVPDASDYYALGTLFAVYVALALRHDRLKKAMTIVLAHRLRLLAEGKRARPLDDDLAL